MEHYKIQQHRKPPAPMRDIKYPFRKMRVNGTFTFPYAKHRTVRSGASKMGAELGWVFRVERIYEIVLDKENRPVRVYTDTGRCVRVE